VKERKKRCNNSQIACEETTDKGYNVGGEKALVKENGNTCLSSSTT
jgi:hypothetical protein